MIMDDNGNMFALLRHDDGVVGIRHDWSSESAPHWTLGRGTYCPCSPAGLPATTSRRRTGVPAGRSHSVLRRRPHRSLAHRLVNAIASIAETRSVMIAPPNRLLSAATIVHIVALLGQLPHLRAFDRLHSYSQIINLGKDTFPPIRQAAPPTAN